jgi:hypothetical protein
MRKGFVLLAVLALAPSVASACESCYGAATESPLIDAAKVGMFLLLAVTLSVQGGFVAFFLHLRRRAKRYAQAQLEAEWNELQRRDSTS